MTSDRYIRQWWRSHKTLLHHLHSELLQIVGFPESDILNVLWQAAATVVSVIEHHSFKVIVQCIESERWGTEAALTVNRLMETDDLEESNMCKSLWLALQTVRNVTHPLARFSIPQYSSTSSLQGLGRLGQPTSSDMSPQSSSPLHCSVLWIQRPDTARGKTLNGIYWLLFTKQGKKTEFTVALNLMKGWDWTTSNKSNSFRLGLKVW